MHKCHNSTYIQARLQTHGPKPCSGSSLNNCSSSILFITSSLNKWLIADYRSEADWSIVSIVHWSWLLSFLQIAVTWASFHSVGKFPSTSDLTVLCSQWQKRCAQENAFYFYIINTKKIAQQKVIQIHAYWKDINKKPDDEKIKALSLPLKKQQRFCLRTQKYLNCALGGTTLQMEGVFLHDEAKTTRFGQTCSFSIRW